eukprot:Gb_10973 [translate_table: standard]
MRRELNKSKSGNILNNKAHWAQVVKGKKPPPIVEMAVQAKFDEERARQANDLNLRVRGLPKSGAPMEIATKFIQETLYLSHIIPERAWFFTDSTLLIRLKSLEDKLTVLRAKRKLYTLENKIYLDKDLRRLQVEELKKARAEVFEARKNNKWAVIHNGRSWIRDSPPTRWTQPWPPSN